MNADVNSFLERFLSLADAGFGIIQGDVVFVLNALIVISVTLAGAMWALKGEAPVAPFFRKVIFVGFFAFLVNNWNFLAGTINRTGAMLGLKAGGGGMTLAQLHDPASIAGHGKSLFGRVMNMGDGMNIFTDFLPLATILIAGLIILLAFFVLALQIFVQLIAFKLGSLAAFVAIPWGVFSGTAWVAERPLGWVAGSAVRLFLLAFVASVAITYIATLPPTMTLDNGGALDVLLFGLTILSLSWLAPMLASEVMQGNPSLSAAQPVQGAVGTLMSTMILARTMSGGARRAPSRRGSGAAAGGAGGAPPARGASNAAPPPPPNYGAMQPRPRR